MIFLKNRNIAIILSIAALMLWANIGMTQTEWVKYGGNPVLDLGGSDAWDDYSVYGSTVLFDGTKYHIWYTGKRDDSNARIGYATSVDGITWEKHSDNPVLALGTNGTWDDYNIIHPTVLFNGTKYQMWYVGCDVSKCRIGYATSNDGIIWEKYSHNPVLDLGESGTWDDYEISGPTVLFDGTEYQMWYSGFDGSNYRIGYATSTDGVTWEKYSHNPVLDLGESGTWDDYLAYSPTVLFDGTKYHMWYTGDDSSVRRIGYATSINGIVWEKQSDNPVLDLGTSGTWDDYFVCGPTVISDGMKYQMWYSGHDGLNYRIGYATSTPPPIECQTVNRVLWKDIDQGWLASGIDIDPGDKGVITVQGFSNADPPIFGWQGWVGPGGYPEDAGGGGIIPDAPFQSIIYKIGESGTARYLGTGGSEITFDADGDLLFGINNNSPEDSDGAFLFTVVLVGECPDIPDGVLGDVSGNKQVTAYDAALILQYCVGLIDKFPIQEMSAAKRAVPAIYELSIPDSSVKADELLIRVPITINNGDSLTAGAFKIKYDSSVLRAVGITPRFMLNGAYWQARIDEEKSEIRFAFAKSSPTTQSNDAALALLEFEPIGDVEGMTTDLVFHDVQIAESISIKNINGSITFLPRRSALLQNYPNPFNPETWIPYRLATDSPLTIHIYNTKGRLVRTISLGNKNAGVYTTKNKAAYWDGRDSLGDKVASGVYFYQLQAGEFRATRKMVILK